jgi:hypothetical protein
MHCTFSTNIDCMKRFMGNISGLPIEPSVGDLVRVWKDSELEVYLQVVARTWTFTNGSDPHLTCELHLPKHNWESLAHFIKVMGEHNIR